MTIKLTTATGFSAIVLILAAGFALAAGEYGPAQATPKSRLEETLWRGDLRFRQPTAACRKAAGISDPQMRRNKREGIMTAARCMLFAS